MFFLYIEADDEEIFDDVFVVDFVQFRNRCCYSINLTPNWSDELEIGLCIRGYLIFGILFSNGL